VHLEEAGNDRRRVAVELKDGTPMPYTDWVTGYPADLIERVLEVKGPAYLCDEIRREEDPEYVERYLRLAVLSYAGESSFVGKRVLDLGCGSGSSSLTLSRMLGAPEIVGVDLVGEFVQLARERAEFYGAANVRFLHSPDGSDLPRDIGLFDFVMLSAVYEHLLPAERRHLLPMIWSHLAPGSILFINQLPHRFSPVEVHTTGGVPVVNYLPDGLALRVTRLLSSRVANDTSWEELLRRGIRGGTVGGILKDIGAPDAILLEPRAPRVNDRIDLWYELSSGSRWRSAKAGIRATLKLFRLLTRSTFVPELTIAIRKRRPEA